MSVCRLDPSFISNSPKWPQESQRKLAPIPVLHGGQHIPKGPWQLRAPPWLRQTAGPAHHAGRAHAAFQQTALVAREAACGVEEGLGRSGKPKKETKNEEKSWEYAYDIPWNGVCFPYCPHFLPIWPQENVGKDWENEGEEWRNDGKNWENGQTPKKALGNQGEIMGIIWKNYEK